MGLRRRKRALVEKTIGNKMRLTSLQKETVVRLAKKNFGDNAQVFLFGSRTDNNLKGGDIDLFIRSENEKELTLKKKIQFLVDLKREIGDRKIDVVLDNENLRKGRPEFYTDIINTCIPVRV